MNVNRRKNSDSVLSVSLLVRREPEDIRTELSRHPIYRHILLCVVVFQVDAGSKMINKRTHQSLVINDFKTFCLKEPI